jgi:hypothetical protein
MRSRLCRHSPCGCEPKPGSGFCDSSCEAEEKASEGAEAHRCACGHPECRPENARMYDPHDDASRREPADVSNPPEVDRRGQR